MNKRFLSILTALTVIIVTLGCSLNVSAYERVYPEDPYQPPNDIWPWHIEIDQPPTGCTDGMVMWEYDAIDYVYYIHSLGTGHDWINNGYHYNKNGEKVVDYFCYNCSASKQEIVPVNHEGWFREGSKTLYAENGRLYNGWQYLGGWMYFINGEYQIGWKYINKKWYYLSNTGKMYANKWVRTSGKWYYLTSSGAMAKSWQKVGGKWYYFYYSGEMATGWLKLGRNWYYLNSDGSMRTARLKQGSKTYRFNSSGVCVNPY